VALTARLEPRPFKTKSNKTKSKTGIFQQTVKPEVKEPYRSAESAAGPKDGLPTRSVFAWPIRKTGSGLAALLGIVSKGVVS
jgi:hypothetical protein